MPIKDILLGEHFVNMNMLSNTIRYKYLEELDTIPLKLLKHYYTKKLSERYGIPFNKNNLDEYFTISFETPDGTSMTNLPASEKFPSGTIIDFKYFVKNSLGNVIIDNNLQWSGADEANAGSIFLGHYISRHLGQNAKPFVYDKGHSPTNMDFTNWGFASGDETGNDHQSQPSFIVLNKYIARFDTMVDGNSKAIFSPYGWKLSGLKLTWNRNIELGGALEGEVILSKEDWKHKLFTASDLTSNTHQFTVKPSNRTEARYLNVFEIKGVWGDILQITNTNSNFINNTKIEFPARTDETITVLRIAFL